MDYWRQALGDGAWTLLVAEGKYGGRKRGGSTDTKNQGP